MTKQIKAEIEARQMDHNQDESGGGRMSETKVLPCPFCGTEAEDQIAFHKWIVYCPDANLETGCPVKCETTPFPTLEEAIAKWNTRAPDPRIAAADAMAKALADAAESLNTVATQAGIDEYMKDALQISGYANSRATVARAALAAYNALR